MSGKLRAQRAKSMKFKDGYMVSSGNPVREYIDSATRHVLLRQVRWVNWQAKCAVCTAGVRLSLLACIFDDHFLHCCTVLCVHCPTNRRLPAIQGVLGIKVRIMKEWDPTGKVGPRTPLPDVVTVLAPKVS